MKKSKYIVAGRSIQMSDCKKYFSEQFLNGLETKSMPFQNKFWVIMDKLACFFNKEDEEERIQFFSYIESQLSYDKPGNMMYCAEVITCASVEDEESFSMNVINDILDAFDDEDEVGQAMQMATHYFLGVRCPEDLFNETHLQALKLMMKFKRYDHKMPDILMISNTSHEDYADGCFWAAMR